MTTEDVRSGETARTPTSSSTEDPVFAVGIGPGDPAYLHERARSILEGADVLVGFETVLDCVGPPSEPDVLPCSYESEARQLAVFAERVAGGEAGAAALMGDPNVSGYTFVEKAEDAVDRPVRIVPGISSIQVAASRSRTPFESSTVVTLHTRGDLETEIDRLVRAAGATNLLVLPRPYDFMPERIATALVDRGVDASLDVHVHERLTFEDETSTRTTLGELAAGGGEDSSFSDLSVVVVRGRS